CSCLVACCSQLLLKVNHHHLQLCDHSHPQSDSYTPGTFLARFQIKYKHSRGKIFTQATKPQGRSDRKPGREPTHAETAQTVRSKTTTRVTTPAVDRQRKAKWQGS